jgi:hypothetical protein
MSATLFEPALLQQQAPAPTPTPAPTSRIQGIPGPLPPGETIVWHGRPAFRSLARHLCHVRSVALYFAVVLAGTAGMAAIHGSTPVQLLLTMAPLLAAAAAALAFLLVMAWLIARTTEYTLTTRRLVIRSGVALPAILVIPYSAIAHAAVAIHPDQTGDLPLTMKPARKIALHRIWPHSRPGRFTNPQPMLRSIPRAGHVATLLASVLQHDQVRLLQPDLVTCLPYSETKACPVPLEPDRL